MGSSQSTTNANDTEPSPILSFHSAARWKIHLNSAKNSTQLMVIDFTASWCGPCRFMEPVLEEFAKIFADVVFVRIDVDELMEVAQEWGVEAMPTFVLVKKGEVVDRVVGAKKEDLKKMIEKYMRDEK
ncbi:thioredoxin H2-like [Tasmannia lanceolata]|uniref:thioredoxin H2-like n=1 Tax=Tasmannia lanceolata TaxID=3420 RepID=UPI004063A515